MTCPHDHGNSNGGNSDYGDFDHDPCNPVTQLFSRRGIVVGLASTTVLCAEPPIAVAFAPAEDQLFMRLALDEVRRGDYPFGAVIVRANKVIARGRNLGKVHDDPTAHAEMTAIRRCVAIMAARRCAAARFTRQASRARRAWARSYGVMSSGLFSPRP